MAYLKTVMIHFEPEKILFIIIYENNNDFFFSLIYFQEIKTKKTHSVTHHSIFEFIMCILHTMYPIFTSQGLRSAWLAKMYIHCTLTCIFLSHYRWQKSDIWSQASHTCRYPISWEVFLDPSDSYFLFADFVDFYTH